MAEEKRTGERTCVIKIVDLFQGYFIRGIHLRCLMFNEVMSGCIFYLYLSLNHSEFLLQLQKF